MTQIIEVETSIGTFKVRKPNAGQRNQALEKAETSWGLRNSILMAELLPKCIQHRPENIDDTTPINQVLDSMEIEDYDKLVVAMSELIKGGDIEEKKTPSIHS